LYALYIVYVKQFRAAMGPMKFTFWVVTFGWLAIMGYMVVAHEPLQLLHTGTQWLWAVQLALLPTVLSLFFINVAIKSIGSTPTAILGAFEPVTAVVISCMCFGEAFTLRLAAGIVLILAAVILIIMRRSG
ncbi:MAG: EamA family transporter, partial [Prevotella sp.]